MRRSFLVLSCAAALVTAAPSAAQAPPLELPGAAGVAAADRWILGVVPGAHVPAAREVAPATYVVARARARELARALRRRGELVYAEPDRRLQRRPAQGGLSDPLSASARWREAVVRPTTLPPPVSPASPLLAVIDSPADLTHPEFSGGQVTRSGDPPVVDAHGTATAAVAAAPDNEQGILGIWPGMRALNVPLPSEIRCSDSVAGIMRALEQRASVINMSYGSPQLCFAEYVALQRAVAAGVILVAAAGNEFANGNPLQFPGSLPHVVTVAAIGSDLRAAFFSGASAAIDLGAPGVGILTAVPVGHDPDGRGDGYAGLDGTSFAAPMVAAAAAWVGAARPELSPDQVVQVVRLSARDVEREGWDQSSGFGMLDIDAALARRPPPRDPSEPNDDVVWIDGRAFARPDRLVWRGGRPRSLNALLDRFEDPHDVYRVLFPPRARVRFSVRPRFGDADLEVLRPGARSFEDERAVVDRSARARTRTDSMVVRNRSGRGRVAYVHVYIDPRARSLDAGYRLTVRRLRRD